MPLITLYLVRRYYIPSRVVTNAASMHIISLLQWNYCSYAPGSDKIWGKQNCTDGFSVTLAAVASIYHLSSVVAVSHVIIEVAALDYMLKFDWDCSHYAAASALITMSCFMFYLQPAAIFRSGNMVRVQVALAIVHDCLSDNMFKNVFCIFFGPVFRLVRLCACI